MRIGELSRRTGVSRRSIRYYESNGLLRSHRTANGWREYDESCVRRVRTIADLLARGLTIEGIRRLEPCLDMGDPAECDDPAHAIEVYRSRLAVLDARLARLHEHRAGLAERLDELETVRQQTGKR